jgi:hypothetical protein
MRNALFFGLFLMLGMLGFGMSQPAHSEPTRLALSMGRASGDEISKAQLWGRLTVEQWFGRENFFVGAELESLSILSSMRSFGGGLKGGLSFVLTPTFEWLPAVGLERPADLGSWDVSIQSSARYSLWALLLETRVALTPLEREGQRRVRFGQSFGMSLGQGKLREDFVALEFEFDDHVDAAADPRLRRQFRRAGIVLISQVEF